MDDSKLLGLCGRLKCCLAYEYEEGFRSSGLHAPGESVMLIQPERFSSQN